MKNLKDEIERILKEFHLEEYCWGVGGKRHDLGFPTMVEALTSLIEQEKERAVRGFAVWLSVQPEYEKMTVVYALQEYLAKQDLNKEASSEEN